MTKKIWITFLGAPDVIQYLDAILLDKTYFILVPEALHFEQFGREDKYNTKIYLGKK